MARMSLNARPRTAVGKGSARRLRASGLVPGVVYGQKKDPVTVSVEPREVVEILNSPWGQNYGVELQIEGESEPRLTLIKDYQVHPWKRRLQHVDFWEFDGTQPVVVSVPLKLTGRSEAEKAGGRAQLVRKVVKVRGLIDDIPASITFDMSTLAKTANSAPVSQVPMPEGLEAVFDDDYNIIQVKLPKAEVEEEEAEVEGAEGESEDAEASEEASEA